MQPCSKADLRRTPEISGHGWRRIKSTCSTRSVLYARKVRAEAGVPPVPGRGVTWYPPALPPEPRQKLQGILSVFLALFLRYHVPAADFPLLVASCTGGAMLGDMDMSNIMPGKGKASSPQHHRSKPACSSPWPHPKKLDYFCQCMKLCYMLKCKTSLFSPL